MPKINEANRIEDLTYGEFFNVQLHNGDNPAVDLTVDFTGMPIKTMAKLAWDAMKVKFRPHVKGMTTKAFLKSFNHQTVTWREMITKSGATSKIAIAEKSPEEIAGEIARLKALLKENAAEKPETDDDTETNDVAETNDNYVPAGKEN